MARDINCQQCGLRNFGHDRFCAKCGHALPASNNSRTTLIIVAVIGGLMILGLINKSIEPSNNRPAATETKTPEKIFHIDKSPEKQAARQKLIQSAINRRLIAKIKFPGKSPEVWVAPDFYTLDFDTKEQLISVVYAYYCDGNDSDIVLVYDNLTGKSIGSYSTLAGGLSSA